MPTPERETPVAKQRPPAPYLGANPQSPMTGMELSAERAAMMGMNVSTAQPPVETAYGPDPLAGPDPIAAAFASISPAEVMRRNQQMNEGLQFVSQLRASNYGVPQPNTPGYNPHIPAPELPPSKPAFMDEKMARALKIIPDTITSEDAALYTIPGVRPFDGVPMPGKPPEPQVSAEADPELLQVYRTIERVYVGNLINPNAVVVRGDVQKALAILKARLFN